MIVKIEPDVFLTKDTVSLMLLLGLIMRKNRYNIFVEYGKINTNSPFHNLSQTTKSVIKQDYIRFDKLPKSKKIFSVIVAKDSTNEKYNIDEAITYLEQPLKIILESQSNDSRFMNCLIRHFDKKDILKRYKDNSFIEYQNAGGGSNTMISLIRSDLAKYRKLPKDNWSYYKAFVIIDSDKKYPEEEYSKKLRDLISELDKFQIPFHILAKREIENYLPDEVFESIRDDIKTYVKYYLGIDLLEEIKSKIDNFETIIISYFMNANKLTEEDETLINQSLYKPYKDESNQLTIKQIKTDFLRFQDYINTYLELSPTQKDFFDVEKGFTRKLEDIKPKEIKELYEDIKDDNFEILKKSNMENYGGRGKFKSTFPTLFNHHKVTKETLLKRCEHHEGNQNDMHGPNELPNLIRKIEKLL